MAARRLLEHDAAPMVDFARDDHAVFFIPRSGVVAQLFARPAARSELIRRVRSVFWPQPRPSVHSDEYPFKRHFPRSFKYKRRDRPGRICAACAMHAFTSLSPFVPRIGASGMSHSTLPWLVLVFQRGRPWDSLQAGLVAFPVTRSRGETALTMVYRIYDER